MDKDNQCTPTLFLGAKNKRGGAILQAPRLCEQKHKTQKNLPRSRRGWCTCIGWRSKRSSCSGKVSGAAPTRLTERKRTSPPPSLMCPASNPLRLCAVSGGNYSSRKKHHTPAVHGIVGPKLTGNQRASEPLGMTRPVKMVKIQEPPRSICSVTPWAITQGPRP
jgi:hypothetical protein